MAGQEVMRWVRMTGSRGRVEGVRDRPSTCGMVGMKEGERNRGRASNEAQREGWKRTSEWRVGMVRPAVGRDVEEGMEEERRKVAM